MFTWYGATIEMDGATETDYTADEVSQCSRHIACILSVNLIGKTKKKPTWEITDEEIATFWVQTPMVSYVNVHAVLDGRRSRAKASSPDDSVSSQVVDWMVDIKVLNCGCGFVPFLYITGNFRQFQLMWPQLWSQILWKPWCCSWNRGHFFKTLADI